MAGGKETPRQKMIGMMYLVLTALLALQVNSAILLKFKFLDDSLTDVNGKTDAAADGTVATIKKAVEKNHNAASDMAVLKQSEEIQAKTQAMVASLHSVREKLITGTGNEAGSNDYKDPDANNKVMPIMIGGKKNGLAYPLKTELNSYADYIRAFVPGVTPLALDGKEDARINKSKEETTREQLNKDFAELNFENTPLVAALAVLSQKETEVLKYQADALAVQAAKVGVKNVVFDRLGAFASAESQTVAAGTKYKAELFMTAAATGLRQIMSSSVGAVPVDPKTNHGKVEFVARPGAFDKDGNAKATWTGSIKINTGGRDTTFKVVVPYTVSKPVMQIQSASVQALYFECGNKLSVQVPALGSQYQPSFSASGAAAITGQKGEVTLIPSAREVTLNVSSGGNAIGSQVFKVRPIPLPTIKGYVGGTDIEDKRGVAGASMRTITLKAIPDPGFLAFLPDDARFRVSRFEVTLARGRRPVQQTKTINGQQGDISDLANSARPDDRLFVEVKSVQRQNFQGKISDVNMPTRTFTVSLQ
ncbi:MAG: gliding motility protein GldM [Janthinobacterium lividum]